MADFYIVRPNGETDQSLWELVAASTLPQTIGSLAAGSYQVRALGASAWSDAVTVTAPSATQFQIPAQAGVAWTNRWTGTGDADTFTYEAGPPAQWRWVSPATGRKGWTLDSFGAGDFTSVTDAEMLVQYVVPADPIDFDVGVALRSGGASGAEDGYLYRHRYTSTGPEYQIAVMKYVGGVFTNLSDYVATAARTTGQVLFTRARVEGTALKLKVWDATDAEPAAWDMEFTASDHASGRIGVYCANGSVENIIRYVGVGLGGDPAPMPA